jgi:hypothetical protein
VANAWTSTAPLATARDQHGAALLSDGRVLVTGGSSAGTRFASTEIYDPDHPGWLTAQSLASARSNFALVMFRVGDVLNPGGVPLIIGGEDGTGNPIGATAFFVPSGGNGKGG